MKVFMLMIHCIQVKLYVTKKKKKEKSVNDINEVGLTYNPSGN